jgi:hypothetical protein
VREVVQAAGSFIQVHTGSDEKQKGVVEMRESEREGTE